MKEKSFKDVLELVDAVKQHPSPVVSNDNIESDPPTLGFLSSDGIRFSITLENFQNSIKNYAPNNRRIALFTAAMKSDLGKKNFCEFVNDGKESKKIEETKYIVEEIEEPSGNIINNNDNCKDGLVSLLNDCAKDIMNLMSSLSTDVVKDWSENHPYGMLLTDVINGNGPKELWLRVILNHLEEHKGSLK